MSATGHKPHVSGQGLFQDFASEGANAKFQNSRGGKYKTKEGQPHIKRTEKPIPRGANRSQGGAKAPPGPPPEINPVWLSVASNTNIIIGIFQEYTHHI